MDYGFLEGLFDFFGDIGSWLTFLAAALALLPPIFLTCVSILIIAFIIFGVLRILINLIG